MYADIFPMFVNAEVKYEFFETIFIIYIDNGIIITGNNIHKMKTKLEKYMIIDIKIAGAMVIFMFGMRE